MTVKLHMDKREGDWDRLGHPLPPFNTARVPTIVDKEILVFGTYLKNPHHTDAKTAVVATVVFEPEQTLDERKALVEHAIDLCDLVHRARSST